MKRLKRKWKCRVLFYYRFNWRVVSGVCDTTRLSIAASTASHHLRQSMEKHVTHHRCEFDEFDWESNYELYGDRKWNMPPSRHTNEIYWSSFACAKSEGYLSMSNERENFRCVTINITKVHSIQNGIYSVISSLTLAAHFSYFLIANQQPNWLCIDRIKCFRLTIALVRTLVVHAQQSHVFDSENFIGNR